MNNQRCAKRVYSGARHDFTGHPCRRAGKVERDGVFYCAIHDPEAAAKKRAEQDAKSSAELAARIAQRNREEGMKALGALLLKQAQTGVPVEQGEAEEIARKHGLIP